MSTLSRQSAGAAFSPTAYPAGVVPLPAKRPQAPAPDAPPRPAPGIRPRQRIQATTLVMLVAAALIFVSLGIAYLSGYAQMTGEKYRTVRLQHALKQQRETQHRLKQLEAIACAPASIENKARNLGMIPAAEKDMVTVGEPLPASTQTGAVTSVQ